MKWEKVKSLLNLEVNKSLSIQQKYYIKNFVENKKVKILHKYYKNIAFLEIA